MFIIKQQYLNYNKITKSNKTTIKYTINMYNNKIFH